MYPRKPSESEDCPLFVELTGRTLTDFGKLVLCSPKFSPFNRYFGSNPYSFLQLPI